LRSVDERAPLEDLLPRHTGPVISHRQDDQRQHRGADRAADDEIREKKLEDKKRCPLTGLCVTVKIKTKVQRKINANKNKKVKSIVKGGKISR